MVFGIYRAGELDEQVDLQEKVYTPDGAGGGAMELSTIATVWAAVRPMGGGEKEESDRVEAITRYRFVMRYRSDLSALTVVRWRGADFNVTAVLDRGPRALYIEVEATRGVAP